MGLTDNNNTTEGDYRTILVVDDEPDVCEYVTIVAEGVGFEATSITDGRSFASSYSRHFDCIVLDLTMPGMDGIELIRFLADNKSSASIILMSGVDSTILHSAEQLAKHHGLNIVGALKKPVSVDDLEKHLERVPHAHSQIAAPFRKTNAPIVDGPTETELREAIANKQLLLHYQPKINMSDGSLAGVEALVRWQHPEKGMIPPIAFIPLAEETGLIEELTTQVTEMAIEQCAEWLRQGERIKVAFNMSAKSLTDLDFPDHVWEAAKERGIDPSLVAVELTETAIVTELNRSLDILTRLRMKGFHLAIDDFGTGYSSMQQLQNLPFDELKIDQSFVKNAANDEEARKIIESTVELGHKLNMEVVVEGIEDKELWDVLRDCGCNQAQGFWMARPMPAGDILKWRDEWKLEE
ncbi:MAG: EAL domain-containing response regulator [Alphaproteobacteria bacterium]|nr:EAL domain-containing response regulator [Rhodospirillales bacterium]MCW9046073.1 EAL domain-containing response regulator [Alphaproteobacteria bacterium]